MVSKFPEFYKLDCHDEWLEDCGSLCCRENHNLRKNAAMLPWSAMDMNWCDFLEALDCYRRERESACQFCTRCKNCGCFKLLCGEAWHITLNSWRNTDSYVVVVWFNTKNWKYPPLPVTVDILNRRFVNNDEKNKILEKEEKNLTNIINIFRTKSVW